MMIGGRKADLYRRVVAGAVAGALVLWGAGTPGCAGGGSGGGGGGGATDSGPDGHVGPPSPDGGSVTLVSGDIYSATPGMLAGGAVAHAIVGENVSFSNGIGANIGNLYVVGTAPGSTQTALSTDGQVYVDGVVVSPQAPERVLYLDKVTGGTATLAGSLEMADLSGSSPAVVTLNDQSGSPVANVPSNGFFFGQNGSEILFVDNDTPSTTNNLLWTDGTNQSSHAKLLGTGTSVNAILMSADRSHAVAIKDLSSGRGTLGWIPMDYQDSSFQTIDTDVAALASAYYCTTQACNCGNPTAGGLTSGTCTASGYPEVAEECTAEPDAVCNMSSYSVGGIDQDLHGFCTYASPPQCQYLNSSVNVPFSISGDGSRVAYETGGSIKVVILQVGSQEIGPIDYGPGQFPALSADGTRLAFYNPAAGQFSVYAVGDSASPPGAPTAQVSATGELSPVFSPDGQYVAFLQNYSLEGTPAGGDIGDVWLLKTSGGPAVRWARNAAWHTLQFWPSSSGTLQVSVLASMHDLTQAVTTSGYGSVLVDDPETLFADGGMPSAPVAENVGVGDFGLLAKTGSVVSLTQPQPPGTLNATIWEPGASSRRPGSVQANVAPEAVSGSLQTSGGVAGLSSLDEAIFQATPGNKVCAAAATPSDLWLVSGTHPARLGQNVSKAALMGDGRVLAIVPASCADGGLPVTSDLVIF